MIKYRYTTRQPQISPAAFMKLKGHALRLGIESQKLLRLANSEIITNELTEKIILLLNEFIEDLSELLNENPKLRKAYPSLVKLVQAVNDKNYLAADPHALQKLGLTET